MVDNLSAKTEVFYRNIINKFIKEIKRELNSDEDIENLKELKSVNQALFNNLLILDEVQGYKTKSDLDNYETNLENFLVKRFSSENLEMEVILMNLLKIIKILSLN